MVKQLKRMIPFSVKDKIKSGYREAVLSLKPGITYQCPYCNYKTKEFLLDGFDFEVLVEKQVIGGGMRHSVCEQCRSYDRERLLYIFLKEKLKVFNDKSLKILHIAPEARLTKTLLKGNFKEYICGDLVTSGYGKLSHVKVMSVLDLPFGDNTFDLLICNHVLEHIINDIDAMKEIHRVLKVGGKAILQVPISNNSKETFEDSSIIDPKEREKVFGQFDHVRIYGQDYPNRLSSVGFKVSRINISKEYEKYGVDLLEDIFLVEK